MKPRCLPQHGRVMQPENAKQSITAREKFVLAALLGAMILVLQFFRPLTHTEDCYITYRCAQNLANGNGPVYNAGERVEAYSSPLHMFAAAALMLVFKDPLWAVNALNILAAILLVLLVYAMTRSLAAAAVCALHPIILNNVGNGLETTLQAALFIAALYFQNSGRTKAGVFAAAAVLLLRPEAALFVGALALYWYFQDGMRAAILRLAVAAVPAGLYEVFRIVYFGEFLPNTYYAKAWGGDLLKDSLMGADYVGRFFLWHGAILLVLAVIGLRRREGRPIRLVAFSSAVLSFAWLVKSGGGYEWGFRYTAPLIPLLVISAFPIAMPRLPKWAPALCCLLILAPSYGYVAKGHNTQAAVIRTEGLFKDLGLALADYEPDKNALLAGSSGQLHFFSGLRGLDYWGLADRHIARAPIKYSQLKRGHMKFDGHYVLDRKPKYITFEIYGMLSGKPYKKGDPVKIDDIPYQKEITGDPRFGENYRPISLPLKSGLWVMMFKRKGETTAQ